jgi:hypothetical protein
MGMEGWSWQRGEREVQGSLYCEEFRARAAICTTTSIIDIIFLKVWWHCHSFYLLCLF